MMLKRSQLRLISNSIHRKIVIREVIVTRLINLIVFWVILVKTERMEKRRKFAWTRSCLTRETPSNSS